MARLGKCRARSNDAAGIVSAGAPLSIWESGLTSVGQDLWVADLESPDVGKLIRISAMVGTTPFPLHPHVGSPAGIASKRDGSALLVSTLLNGSDALLEVDLPSGDTRSWTSGVSTTDSAPAGLHRAKGADIFAWCDRGAASDPGALYRVEWH